MKRFLILTAGLLLSTAGFAQLRIGAECDRKDYIPFEPIKLTIQLDNNSGNLLKFSSPDDGFINCIVEDERGHQVQPTALSRRVFAKRKINLARGLVLSPGQSKSLVVNINRFYEMSRPQNYSIRVRVVHKRLGNREFRSQPTSVNVIEGVEIMSRKVGVPSASKEEIAQRDARLLSFQGKETDQYIMQIDDAKRIYRTVRLCQRMSSGKPDFEIDARSHIHILIQTEPKVFSFWEFSVDGSLRQASQYRYTKENKVPRLYRDPDIGRVMVIGGERVVPGDDEELELPVYQGPQEATTEE